MSTPPPSNTPSELAIRHQAVGELYKAEFATLDEAFRVIAETAAQTLHTDRVSIWLFADEEETAIYCVHEHNGQHGGSTQSRRRKREKDLLYLAADDAYLNALRVGPVVAIDSARDYDSASEIGRYLYDYNVGSLLDVPVRVGGAIVGILCHEHQPVRSWSDEDRALAIRLGDILALAIENDRHRRAVALEARFRALVEQTPDSVALGDSDGALEYLNPPARRLLGLAPDEPIRGYHFVDFLTLDSRALVLDRVEALARREGSWTGELSLRNRRGQEFKASMTITMYRGQSGDVEYMSCVIRDIASHTTLERRLADAQARYEAVLAHSSEAVFLVDAESGQLKQVSASLCRLLGYSEAELMRMTIFDLVEDTVDNVRYNLDACAEKGHFMFGERQYRHRQGHYIDLEVSALLCVNEASPTLSVRVRDISERLQRRRDIERLAYFDPLTGLANSNLLRERGEAMLAESLDDETRINYVIVQIDRWQRFSDTLGYEVAESLLQQVARRLEHIIGARNILVARLLEGAEFGLLFRAEEQNDRDLLGSIQKAFAAPFQAEQETVHLVTRGGAAHFPTHAVSFKDLTKRAGIALRNAHLKNRTYCIYEAAQSGRPHDERLLEEDLRQAIGTRQIQLRYQPITRPTGDGQIVSVEALVRWKHPQEGFLQPSDFIALAEDSHLIVDLDRSIMLEATRAVSRWLQGTPDVALSVNLSALTLMNPRLIEILRQALEHSRLPPSQLCMEITETAIMHDRRTAAEALRQISALGVQIALDDFGTGYSSLAYLKNLTIDVLKIDRDFIRGIGMDVRDERAIETIISLGHDLDMQVLAEGVETRAQMEWLSARNIDRLQGYYLGMPLTLSELRQGTAQGRGIRMDH